MAKAIKLTNPRDREDVAARVVELGGVLRRLASGGKIKTADGYVLMMTSDGDVYQAFQGGDDSVGAPYSVQQLLYALARGRWELA